MTIIIINNNNNNYGNNRNGLKTKAPSSAQAWA